MNIMTPSEEISIRQIGKIHELLDPALRKSGLPKKETQEVLKTEGRELIDEMVAVIRKRVEARSEMIVRRVRVNRALNPEKVIDETGHIRGYVDSDVLATMPKGDGEEVDVYFFPTKKFVPVSQYDSELASRGLVADPRAQTAVNRDDPSFADEHPNGVQWDKDSCAAFDRWDDERWVDVSRVDDDWDDYWWLGGVRKPATE